MALPLLEAYVRAMPGQEAGRQADAAIAMAVGTGTAGKEGQRLLREWQRLATGDDASAEPGPSDNGHRQRGVGSPSAMVAMAAMGITVKVEG